MWIAVGLGLYLVPEVARRAHLRESASGVLASSMGLIALAAAPMVIIYAVAAKPILHLTFKFTGGAAALPLLGLALSCLAGTYLAVQYHLALHRWRFIAVLAAAAIAQPIVVAAIGPDLAGIALGLLGLNALLAVAMLGLALRAASHASESSVARSAQTS
jgi:hypothetical protein